MIIYIALPTIALFLGKKKFISVFFAIFTLLSGLRSIDVGTDTIAYVNFYNNLTQGHLTWNAFEPGYLFFNKFFSLFLAQPFMINVLISSLTLFLIFYTICKLSKNIPLSIFLYVALGFFMISLNISRQFVAVAFVFYSFNFIRSKKPLKFIFCVALASSFHFSAIVCLLIYPIGRNGQFATVYTWTLALSLTLSKQIFHLTPYARYITASTESSSSNNITGILIYASILVMSFLLKKEKDNDLDLFLHRMTTIAFILSFIGNSFLLATRVSYYFSIAAILLLPNKLALCNKQTRLIIGFAIISCAYYVLFFYLTNNIGAVVPYRIWNGM